MRQNKIRRARNKSTIRAIRTAEKKFLKALPSLQTGASSTETATGTTGLTTHKTSPQELLRVYTSKIDKAAQKGIVKSKKASRKISRLSKQLQPHL